MERQKIFDEVKATFGSVPGYLDGMPDNILEQKWAALKWVLSDTKLSARDKALISFGAATAIGCPY